jgi:hypothetical protein
VHDDRSLGVWYRKVLFLIIYRPCLVAALYRTESVDAVSCIVCAVYVME